MDERPEPVTQSEERKRRGLLPGIRGRMMFVLLSVLLPVLLVLVGVFHERYRTQRDQALDSQARIARSVADMTREVLFDAIRTELAIGISLTRSARLSNEQIQEILELNKTEYPILQDFHWMDPDGRIIASTQSRLAGAEYGNRSYIREIIDGKEWSVSELFISSSTGRPIFSISRGIRSGAGALIGILSASVLSEKLGDALSVGGAGNTVILVLDNEGKVVHRIPGSLPTWGQRWYLKNIPDIEEALKGKEVVLTIPEADGVKRVFAFTAIRDTGWIAAAGRVEGEVIAPLISSLARDCGLLLGVLVVSFLTALAISGTISGPIRGLQKHVTMIGRTGLWRRVEVAGPEEIRDLAEAFNLMSREISVREEDLHQARAELEIRVLKRTAELKKVNESLTREISRHEKTERVLIQTNKLLGVIFSTVHFLVAYMDVDFNFIRVNEAYAAADDKHPSYFVGRNHFDLYPNEENEAVFKRVRDTGEPFFVFEKPFVYPNNPARGVTYWDWSLQPVRGDDGQIMGLVLCLVNVSDRKLTQQALQRSEEKYRMIFESSPLGIIHFDQKGVLTACNDTMAKMVGSTREELTGINLLASLLNEEAKACVLSCLSGATASFEGSYTPVTGHRSLYLKADFSPIFLSDGAVGGGAAIIEDISVRKRAEESLKESEEQLRFLSSRLLTAQEEERKRISRDLHDSISSSLSAIKFSLESNLELAEKGVCRTESLKSLVSMTQRAMDEARRMMTDLRPSMLDDLGIMTTLKWLFGQFQAVYSGISIQEKIGAVESDIPEPLKIVIFRITQEAFHNIAKYSNASMVSFALERTGSRIDLSIEDDGTGFDLRSVLAQRDAEKGFGITGMRERTEFSGGAFHIRSEPGKGTGIRASWPLDGFAATPEEE